MSSASAKHYWWSQGPSVSRTEGWMVTNIIIVCNSAQHANTVVTNRQTHKRWMDRFVFCCWHKQLTQPTIQFQFHFQFSSNSHPVVPIKINQQPSHTECLQYFLFFITPIIYSVSTPPCLLLPCLSLLQVLRYPLCLTYAWCIDGRVSAGVTHTQKDSSSSSPWGPGPPPPPICGRYVPNVHTVLATPAILTLT